MPDDAIRNLIRQAKVEQIYSYMQTGSRTGMQTMEQALSDLTVRQVITPTDALARSTRRSELTELLERSGVNVNRVGHADVGAAGLRLAQGRDEHHPWWKKEISLRRRPRGTVVVAKPVIPPEIVERAAAIFELESDPPAPAEPSIWPVEPAQGDVLASAPSPAPLPQVWPKALAEMASYTPPPAIVPPARLDPGPQPVPSRCRRSRRSCTLPQQAGAGVRVAAARLPCARVG